MPTKAFRVLLFLYEEKAPCWASGLFSLSMYIYIASIIRVLVKYFLRKHSSRRNRTITLEGNTSSSLNLKRINLIQVLTIWDTMHTWHTPNLADKSSSSKAIFKRQSTRKISFSTVKALLGSGLYLCLKGLGHAILGNFSTDEMVIELTKI